jgi:hypothetical protein
MPPKVKQARCRRSVSAGLDAAGALGFGKMAIRPVCDVASGVLAAQRRTDDMGDGLLDGQAVAEPESIGIAGRLTDGSIPRSRAFEIMVGGEGIEPPTSSV